MSVLYEIIEKYAEENGICDFGVCGAERFDYIRDDIEKNADILKGFVEQDIEKRINPDITLEGAKSIISIAVKYNYDMNFKKDNKIRGYISMGAVGEDYHIYMAKLLKGLAEKLSESLSFRYAYFSDTGPLCDRAVALKCKIGYKGKNGCVVSKNGGSAVFLGYIITDIDLSCFPDFLLEREFSDFSCEKCGLCVRSCPSGALNEAGFKIEKCVSYITQLKRRLSYEEMKLIGINIYGCDMCQKVCAKNTEPVRQIIDINEAMPEIEHILGLTNRQFKEKYGKTAMGWRGAAVIKRNAVCALLKYDEEYAFNMICGALKSESALVRQTAAMAVALKKQDKGIDVLKEAEKNEKDNETVSVIHESLSFLRREIKWATGTQEA